jgi:putative membrane protein
VGAPSRAWPRPRRGFAQARPRSRRVRAFDAARRALGFRNRHEDPDLSTSSLPGAPALSRDALAIATLAIGAVLAITGLSPADRHTWWLEVLPVVGIVATLWITRRRFPLTPVLHACIAVALAMICVGAHYTFERVPAGEWLQSALGLARNPYDRIGHVVQGIVPALAARELLARASPLGRSRWLEPLAFATALAVSAGYELLEWAIALAQGGEARKFLGMQGDPWDAQWDMACAFAGAALGLSLLRRVHDRALARLAAARATEGGPRVPRAAPRAAATRADPRRGS